MKKTILLLSLLIGLVTAFYAQTTIPDGTDVSGTWTLAGSPYIIEGEATVPVGETLTILPGVTVKLNIGTGFDYSQPDYFDAGILIVEGSLIAVGGVEVPITFTRDGTDGNWGQIFFNSSEGSYLSFCNFEYGYRISNMEGLMFAHGVISFFSSAANIANCDFSYTQGAGIACYTSNVNFYGNILHHNTSGIYSREGDMSNFANNIIYNNINIGIYVTDENTQSNFANNLIYSSYTGIGCANNSAPNFANNTVAASGDYGLSVDNANPNLTNMIFNNNLDGDISALNANTVIDISYSLFEDAEDNLPSQVNHYLCTFEQDPLFKNASEHDYQLLTGSPCIDAGTPDTNGLHIPELDLAENPRVDNNRIDIGAYEYQGETSISNLTNTQFALTNYPNPFSTETIISFNIPKNEKAELKITDIKGNTIKVWDITNKEQIIWQPNNIPSGIYIYQLKIGNKTITNTAICY